MLLGGWEGKREGEKREEALVVCVSREKVFSVDECRLREERA